MANIHEYDPLGILAGLVNTAKNTNSLFEYLECNRESLMQESKMLTVFAEKTAIPLYTRFLAEALQEYFDSKILIKSIEDAKQYVQNLHYESGSAPWILKLLQSLWHLANDPLDITAIKAVPKNDERIAILVSIFNETRFCELAFKSIRKFSDMPHYIIAVNNSTQDMTAFQNHVTENALIDEWFDTGQTHHGKGLQKAIERVRSFRYIATLDSDAVGIKSRWLGQLIGILQDAEAGIVGPLREPQKKTLIGQVIHPSCMVIDQKRTADKFNIDFRSFWPFWDVAGLLSWDYKLHNIPISVVSHDYNGNCADCSTLINNSVRHFWYTSRIAGLTDDAILDGRKVGEIRARLDIEFNKLLKEPAAQETDQTDTKPFVSVVLTACNRPDMLKQVLDGFAAQTCSRNQFEVIVVDDGSSPPVKNLVESLLSQLNIRYIYQQNSGLAAARNTGIKLARGNIVLFHDDDDFPDINLVAEHIKSHKQFPDENIAVLGYWAWHPELKLTPLMNYITGSGGQYFGYTNMVDGQFYEPIKWWGGQISAKASLLKSLEGPFDEQFRFGYEDTELVCRLADRNLKILYNSHAKNFIIRSMNFEEFCRRRIRQGRALYHLAQKHPAFTLKRYHLVNALNEYQSQYAPNLMKWYEVTLKHESQINSNSHTLISSIHRIWSLCFRSFLLRGYFEEQFAVQAGTTTMSSPVDLAKKLAIEDVLPVSNVGATQQIAQASRPLRIMLVSNRLPRPQTGSSNVRIHNILKLLLSVGNSIEYVYFVKESLDETYIRQWQKKIKFTFMDANATELVNYLYFNPSHRPDILWVTNLWMPAFFYGMQEAVYWLRRLFPEIRIIIDTMDFHYKKYMRKFEFSKNDNDKNLAEQFAILEKRLYPLGDRIVTVTDEEGRDIVSDIKDCKCSTISNIHEQLTDLPCFEARNNIVFIGSMHVNHNIDAAGWFIKEVFPLIRQNLKDIEFHVIGFGSEQYKNEFEVNPGVKVIGSVADAERAVANYRLFVCPMQYGAGMKGKIGTAAAAGTPFVTTTIGAEGFNFTDREECFIADDANEFAIKCVQLINNKTIWQQFSQRTRDRFIAAFSPEAVAPKIIELLKSVTSAPARKFAITPSSGNITKIAVVTAVHNGEKFLAEMIESVLNQTMKEFEFWLLDDCSTDGTRRIIEQYAKLDARIIPVFFNDNKGPYVRRNYAIQRTKTPFIVIHDADDIMTPTKLEVLCRNIEADDNIGIVGHWYYNFVDEFKGLAYTTITPMPLDIREIKENLLRHGGALAHGAAIIRRKLFEIVGPYDENPFSSDSVWLQKAALYWNHTGNMYIKNIPDCLMLRRTHEQSQVASLPAMDPRGRRYIFNAYSVKKIDALAEQLQHFNGSDEELSKLFKSCSCANFLRDCDHIIKEAALKPLDEEVLLCLVYQLMELFDAQNLIGVIKQSYHIEVICPEAPQRFRNFDLFKAMAFYALGHADHAWQSIEREIQNHNNNGARCFMNDYKYSACTDNIVDWFHKYNSFHELEISEVQGEVIDETLLATGPLVSVIIAVDEKTKHISTSISSVLKQIYSRFELLIVDHGSISNIASVIDSAADTRIKHIHKANTNLSVSLNEGIRQARGEYIICLDANDVITPYYIYKHVAAFLQNPEASLIYCDYRFIDEQGNHIRLFQHHEYSDNRHLIRDMFRCGYSLIKPRGLIRRNVFDLIGLFDESLFAGENYDLMRRFISRGCKAVRLPKPLYLERGQPENPSNDNMLSEAKSHFIALHRWAETFKGEELFPDVNWSRIAPDNRGTYLQMLIGATYRNIARNYVQSQTEVSAAIAFDLACGAFKESLKYEPNNTQAKTLLDQCESEKRQLSLNEMAVSTN